MRAILNLNFKKYADAIADFELCLERTRIYEGDENDSNSYKKILSLQKHTEKLAQKNKE